MATFPPTLPTATLTPGTLTNLIAGGFAQSTGYFVPLSVVQGTANGASTVTVAAPQVTANSLIIPALTTVGGTVGALPTVLTTTAGTGFTFKGTASDTSVYSFLILS